MVLTVELRAAKIPWLGLIALHYWFVILHSDRSDRWEVWQRATVPSSAARPARHLHWGHLHTNLMEATSGVGNGPSWTVSQWQDQAAIDLAHIIESSPAHYPYCDRYCFWPGPNSNTYVQWIFHTAQHRHHQPHFSLSWKGWGKNFPTPKLHLFRFRRGKTNFLHRPRFP